MLSWGFRGGLGARYPNASYVTIHGGLKNLEEDIRGLQEEVDVQLGSLQSSHQAKMGALKFEAAQASARSSEVKRWMEQTQATGRGTSRSQAQHEAEVGALKSRCDFLEGAFTQMAAFVTTLKDKVDMGISVAPAHSPSFVVRQDFDTMAREVQVALNGFRQEMKGAPLEFGGYSFQGLDSCVAWARTNMPEASYQCIPGMFYGLCLIQEAVLYKQDMRDDDIQAHRVQRSPMQSAVVELVNTAVPLIVEGPKTNVLKDPKYDLGAMKTFGEWKPTNGQGGASARLKEGLEAAWQQMRGAINMFLSGHPVARSVMTEMLAEYKILTSQLFITEITLYYDEILSKTGGDPPHSKEVKESCWALFTKLLRTVLKEVHKVRHSLLRRCPSGLIRCGQMACFSTLPWRSCACCGSFLHATGATTPSLTRVSSVTCSKHVCLGRCTRIKRRARISSRSMHYRRRGSGTRSCSMASRWAWVSSGQRQASHQQRKQSSRGVRGQTAST